MRKPDYNKMRSALACQEAETMQEKDVYEILLFGTKGWKDCDDEQVLDEFVNLWGTKSIPKVEVTK